MKENKNRVFIFFTFFLLLLLPMRVDAFKEGRYHYKSSDGAHEAYLQLDDHFSHGYQLIYVEGDKSNGTYAIENWKSLKKDEDRFDTMNYFVMCDNGALSVAKFYGYYKLETAQSKVAECQQKTDDVALLSLEKLTEQQREKTCYYDKDGNLIDNTYTGQEFIAFHASTDNVRLSKRSGYVGTEKVNFNFCGNVKDFFPNNEFKCPSKVYYNKNDGGFFESPYYSISTDESLKCDKSVVSPEDFQDTVIDLQENQPQTCEGLFGVTENGEFKEESFGWIIQKLLNYIKIAGPILVILFSMFEFAKAIVSSDDDAMKKAQSRLVIRLVAVVALFLLPFVVGEALKLINGMSNPTCYFK